MPCGCLTCSACVCADVDSCVPYNGNELWTSSLDIPVVTPWRAWMHNKQVAGYATTFESNFQFVTVKGETGGFSRRAVHALPPSHCLAVPCVCICGAVVWSRHRLWPYGASCLRACLRAAAWPCARVGLGRIAILTCCTRTCALQVPQFRPVPALVMFTHFINDTPF